MHKSVFARQVGLHHIWNKWRCWLQHISVRTFFFSPRLSFCSDCQTKIRNNIEKKIECCGCCVGVQICANTNTVCDCAYVFVRAHAVYQSPLRRYLKQMITFHVPCLRVCFGLSARSCVPIGEKSRRFTGKPALSRKGFGFFFYQKPNRNEWCLKSRLSPALKRCGDRSSFLKTH